MRMTEQFINQYPISKTLRFSLIPIGETEENFNKKLFLEADRERAIEYEKAKKIMDKYHRYFIDEVLSNVYIDEVKDYAILYYKSGKSEADLKKMSDLEAKMRKIISKAFLGHKTYKPLFGKEIIQQILPEFLDNEEEKATIRMFENFTTYFSGFYENRKNLYTDEEKSTAISFRCINDNLPKFLDNITVFEKIKSSFENELLQKIDEECLKLNGIYVRDIFCVEYFSLALSQQGIDRYNNIIGGYTDENGEKIQGVNEYINLYNQQVARTEKSKKLPLMKMLYKQMLSDRESISFIPESFESDDEVIGAVKAFFSTDFEETLSDLNSLFGSFGEYDMKGIYIQSGPYITEISNAVFGSWNTITDCWNKEYENLKPMKKSGNADKYMQDRSSAYKKIKSFSVCELQRLVNENSNDKKNGDICEYIKQTVFEKISNVLDNISASSTMLSEKYSENHNKKLSKNQSAIKVLKDLLDSVKDLEKFLKALLGTGKEDDKCELFYGEFLGLYNCISSIDRLYDKVRNYVTKKPYSNNKIKLNFNNSYFLSGWAQNFETKGAILLKNKNNYYIGIIDKKLTKKEIEELYSEDNTSEFEHIVYDYQKPDNKNTPRLFIRSKGTSFAPAVSQYDLPINDIIDIYDNGYFKTEYRAVNPAKYKESLTKLIDYFKLGFTKHESYKHYNFRWKASEQYNDSAEFYRDTMLSCYALHKKRINEKVLNSMISNGQLFVFQIYNKDFSPYSHGKENLHTMYFKMLFDEKNLENVVYQLNGGAEMFYRDASITKDEMIVHKANENVKNKNDASEKKYSCFEYDIIKDRRYTKRQFLLHLPITLNFKAKGNNYINNDVRSALKETEKNYVVGIDRGERNLLYVCVIDNDGNIVEQKSLNEIVSDNNYKVNYHSLLSKVEGSRDKARKSWGTIENIKELKEGYMSQVIHQICEYVIKYDAIIALEDLNMGFKKGRFKVEKQVYQKFENMLCSKLNYLVKKDRKADEPGGVLNAYQLTNKVDGVSKGRQNGIIFYVPAWLTSKIDPVTGFVDLLKPKYVNMADTVAFVERIDFIRYNSNEDIFEFDIDYSKFPKGCTSYKKQWTVCSYGERIITFRNVEKNNEIDNKTIDLTEEFKSLFGKYNIKLSDDMKGEILNVKEIDFYKQFMKLLAYTFQMRNSETNNVDVDYLISPVRGEDGTFYDSRKSGNYLPENADANGAYNIARKALWALEVLKATDAEMLKNANLSITNAQWLEYVQK